MDIQIFINAREHTIFQAAGEATLGYVNIVELAELPFHPGYTVAYERGPEENQEGTLLLGQSVKIQQGMRFNCVRVNRA